MSDEQVETLDLKACPACAEQIQRAAIVCRFCGYDFQTGMIPRRPSSTNGFAVASLVLGIVWLWWLGSLLAVIFGSVALAQIGRSEGHQGGKGLAVAGLVLGIVGLGFLALILLISPSGVSSLCVSTGSNTVCT